MVRVHDEESGEKRDGVIGERAARWRADRPPSVRGYIDARENVIAVSRILFGDEVPCVLDATCEAFARRAPSHGQVEDLEAEFDAELHHQKRYYARTGAVAPRGATLAADDDG